MAAQTKNTIDKLFSVGAHFGYSKSRRHPSTSKFLYGAKGGVELIDLEQTSTLLDTAKAAIKDIAGARGTVLFVGSKAEAREALERAARRTGQPYVSSRWIGGTLTNFNEIKKRLARLTDLTTMREKGELVKFTKHERLLLDREINNLELMFGGLRGMEKQPQAMFVVDPRREHIAVAEAHVMHIPVIALMNTDCNAEGIAHPIPGNDASRETITYILDEISSSFEQGLNTQSQ